MSVCWIISRPAAPSSFIASLYDQLSPGGLLMIANMKDVDISCFWPMEFICDWDRGLSHRRRDARARNQALDGAEVEVRDDSSGRVCMLYVRKPR